MRLILVSLLAVMLLCSGCQHQKPAAPQAEAGIRFVRLAPVQVTCGDPDGTPLEGHVEAVAADGTRLTEVAFSAGQYVELKSFSINGQTTPNQTRVYAPASSCSGQPRDVIEVQAFDSHGHAQRAELLVTILQPPHEEDRSPQVATEAVSGKKSIRITSPRPGARLAGVVQQVTGEATGVPEVEVVVHSNTGDYSQGTAPVINGSFLQPVYLGEALYGRGEYFRISARGTARNARTVSNRVQVLRTK